MRSVDRPDLLPDALVRLRETIELHERHPYPEGLVVFMLSTPAHRLLRIIYGGHWGVVRWALGRALDHIKCQLTPQWWLEWQLRRAERET